MLLAERLALLLLDPHSGTLRPHGALDAASLLAAALLADLVLAERVRARTGRLQCDGAMPLAHPLLMRAQQALGDRPLPPAQALDRVRRLPALDVQVLDALVRRDVLHRPVGWTLLARGARRYPLRSQQAHARVRDRFLRAAAAPDAEALALLLLADAAGLSLQLDAAAHGATLRHLARLDGESATGDSITAALALLRRALLDI